MDGLAGYGSEGSENSPNALRMRKMDKPQKVAEVTAAVGVAAECGDTTSSGQLEAEWANFQAMISAEKSPECPESSELPTGDVPCATSRHDSESDDNEDSAQRQKHSDSSSESESGSDRSGQSHSNSSESDDSSDDSAREKKCRETDTNIEKDKSRSKSPISAPSKKQRSSRSSSESGTEKKPAPIHSAGKANGESHAEPSDKDRRPFHRSPSSRRQHSRSHRSRSHERKRKVRHRSRSHERRRRRRPRGSRSRGRRSTSKSHERPRRISRSHEQEDKSENRKSGEGPSSGSRPASIRDKRRSRSRSPRRRRRGCSRSHSHSRRARRSHSRSPHRGLRRRRRKRRRRRRHVSGRPSRSWSRSRSASPVVKKKRNEPLNYKEKLKQSFLQVQKQAAEGKLNLDDLATKVCTDKPNIQPLMGKDSGVAGLASGQLSTLTPQQALLQTMAAMHQKNVAAMHQKAQELTGVTVPKYYNPASVNPLKYAEQFQKRKLLWGKNKKPDSQPSEETVVVDQKKEEVEEKPTAATKPKTQWDGALFSQDQDGKQAAKFRKLMGMKHGEALEGDGVADTAAEDLDDTQLKKHEEMFSRLDQEYEFARMATHTHRGIGLGFTTMHHQYTNK